MSYQIRNILILTVFILGIVAFTGYKILYSYPSDIGKIEQDAKKLQKQVKVMEDKQFQLEGLTKELAGVEDKLANIDKVVVNSVTTPEAYGYLNQILEYSGLVQFDLTFTQTKHTPKYGYHLFRITGEASFTRVYKFLWYIERGPQIYKVRNFSMRGVEMTDPETEEFKMVVPFEMTVAAFFAKVDDVPSAHRTLAQVSYASARNPFYPFVKRDLPINSEEQLEIERASLKAVTSEKALIEDHLGKIHTLELGAEVFLGFLTKLNPDKGEAEFSLNKAGVFERVILTVKTEEDSK